jgi:hypothetical protein
MKSIDKKIREKIYLKTRRELILIAEDFRISSSRKNKQELIDEFLKPEHKKQLIKVLGFSFWDRYHNHIYGIITTIACILCILFYVFPKVAIDKENKIIEERIKDGIELLNDDQTTSIIAGIQILNQVAIDASKNKNQENYVGEIKKIFCAFIRENSVIKERQITDSPPIIFPSGTQVIKPVINIDDTCYIMKPTIIFQTIIDNLFRNDTWKLYAKYPTDLQRSVFKYCNFNDAHLDGAHLRGAHFEGAWFDRAHLESAILYGSNFEGAIMRKVHLEDAVLHVATLKEGRFIVPFAGSTNFNGASLDSAYLEFTDLSGSYINENTTFKGTIHEGKILYEIRNYKPPIWKNNNLFNLVKNNNLGEIISKDSSFLLISWPTSIYNIQAGSGVIFNFNNSFDYASKREITNISLDIDGDGFGEYSFPACIPIFPAGWLNEKIFPYHDKNSPINITVIAELNDGATLTGNIVCENNNNKDNTYKFYICGLPQMQDNKKNNGRKVEILIPEAKNNPLFKNNNYKISVQKIDSIAENQIFISKNRSLIVDETLLKNEKIIYINIEAIHSKRKKESYMIMALISSNIKLEYNTFDNHIEIKSFNELLPSLAVKKFEDE